MSKYTRISKQRGYTVIPNGLLPEGEVSARAWGIYAYLLSRPEGWVIHVRQLQTIFTEGRDAIYTAMKQLRGAGLLEMESYQEPGQPPKKRYVMVNVEELLQKPPNTDSQDTGNQDRKSRTLTTTDITTTEFTQDHSTVERSSTDTFHDQSSIDQPFHEQPAAAREKSSAKQYDDHLPKEQWNHLKRLLQLTGEAIRDTKDFYSPVAQDRWADFETALEDHTADLPYGDLILDLVLNGKWTVNAKVADWYAAGAELNTLFNTARAC